MAVLGGMVWGHWAPARAKAQETPVSEANTRAKAHFEAAAVHYGSRRFREAIAEFHSAAAVAPSPELWFNIARAHEALGEHAQAVAHYRRYLDERVDAPDAADVRRRIDDLQHLSAPREAHAAAAGLLRIDVNRDGALLHLDSRPVGRSPIQELLEIAPGSHRLDVTLDGHLPFRAQLDAQVGVLTAAFVELSRDDAPVLVETPRLWTWITASVAGAALLTGATFGVLAVTSRDDGDIASARDHALVSDIGIVSGVLLGAAALVVYRAESTAPSGR